MHVFEKAKNLTLCGLPTVGKTQFGKALARYLSFNFFDTDQYILSQKFPSCSSIREVFQICGDSLFSDLEITALQAVPSNRTVVALGGGTLMQEKACDIIKQNSTLVYLSLPLEEIYQRLSQRGLPERLQQANDVDSLLKNRINYMLSVADYHFPLDKVDFKNPSSILKSCETFKSLICV